MPDPPFTIVAAVASTKQLDTRVAECAESHVHLWAVTVVHEVTGVPVLSEQTVLCVFPPTCYVCEQEAVPGVIGERCPGAPVDYASDGSPVYADSEKNSDSSEDAT